MGVRIIIGKSFGDEGKGLAVDYFARQALKKDMPCLVVRHNGGAQAGHTVDLPESRFVFHQLSSGSFCRADTLWADTFLPDLYKLPEEAADFCAAGGTLPHIMAFGGCACVVIDDVLLNIALETARGRNRHGSCGMGIDEAVQRSKHAPYRLTLRQIKGLSAGALYRTLRDIRSAYLDRRLRELGLSPAKAGSYGELLFSDNVLRNAAEGMCRGAELVEIIPASRTESYGEVIFEGAQGLLLDENYLDYAPYLTPSRTGLMQPLRLCRELFGKTDAEAVYVSRTYVTRHGQGPLPHEGAFAGSLSVTDDTNRPNEWQGALRFAPHGTPQEFFAPLRADAGEEAVRRSLLLTHLNETGGCVCTVWGNLPLAQWCGDYGADRFFDRLYLSETRFSADISIFQ